MDTEEIRLEGRRLAGRYVLEEQIAAGALGTMWRALDEVLGRAVAVKILHQRLAGDPAVVERFRAEAMAAARLSHPAVMRVFDTGVDDGLTFIVMELRRAWTLREILADRGPFEPGDAARVVVSVLQGLAHAHREGVIHGDLKPDNVLVDPEGTVKVTDFGIGSAVSVGRDLTTAAELLGRVPYVAPEELEGREVDGRADVYAAGAILYELLTGSVPVTGDPDPEPATSRLPVHLDVAPPGALRRGIPDSVGGVAMRALAHDPDDRFQSAEEMVLALSPAVPSPTVAAPPLPGVEAPEPESTSFFRTWMAAPLILLAVAGVAVGAIVAFQDRETPESGGLTGGRPIEIVAASDHDPLGDGQENPGSVASAIDGNVATGWSTEGYSNPDLGGLKDGVGILLDLGTAREVGGIDLRTSLPGWRFELYGGDDPDNVDARLTARDGGTSFVADAETALELTTTRHRYLLLWFTELVSEEDGRFRAHIAEVSVLPPSG